MIINEGIFFRNPPQNIIYGNGGSDLITQFERIPSFQRHTVRTTKKARI